MLSVWVVSIHSEQKQLHGDAHRLCVLTFSGSKESVTKVFEVELGVNCHGCASSSSLTQGLKVAVWHSPCTSLTWLCSIFWLVLAGQVGEG